MQLELHTQIKLDHAVGLVSKFNAAPTQAHLTVVKSIHIFRYLKGPINLKLQYRSTGEKMLGHSVAGWAKK